MRFTYHITDPIESADKLLKWLLGFSSDPVTKIVAIYYQSNGTLNVARTEMSPDELQEVREALSREISAENK